MTFKIPPLRPWKSSPDPDAGTPAPLQLPTGGVVPVIVRRSARARRSAIRIRAGDLTVELVVPERARLSTALEFLDSRRDWLVARLTILPEPVAFKAGAVIPVLGRDRVLQTTPRPLPGGGPFRLSATTIDVAGRDEHIARRTRDGLVALAGTILRPAALDFAERVGRRPSAVMIGNPRTRWGSCSSKGVLRFSWRLVLAPEPVLRYVAAHEVAHLLHMNHGPAFWALVQALYPEFERERAWLKQHGSTLMRFG